MNGVGLHRKLEENAGLLIFGILFVSAIGGLVQVLPSIFQESLQTPTATTKPYGALELAGRDVYIREACSVCHSQQIRPLLAEVRR
ncbi:MAG: cbb3-type cytochrome c oxidase subunit II, partial [Gammaproteobacteria bacterium]|nr:cbb3-type cytochrome c oxidase subunit II [Gammaproteobacteria bacterium]